MDRPSGVLVEFLAIIMMDCGGGGGVRNNLEIKVIYDYSVSS